VKVAVVGAGGVGGVFGGRLAAAGHDVWLVHRRREVVEALRRDGLQLDGPDGTELLTVHATDDPGQIGSVDLVLILTKSADTRAAAESSRALIGAATSVVTLQNGLGNLETIGEVLGAERALLGMTYLGAAVVGPGNVRLTAPGATFIGEPSGAPSERAVELARSFSEAGLPTQATDRLLDMVWGKLVINAAMNATCALTSASAAAALGSEAARALLGLVAEETATVARALGFTLPYADAAVRVRQHCRDVGDSKPSMLQDMERGRPTEIDAINGAVVREGKRLGVPTPYNEALLLLVKAREEVSSRPNSRASTPPSRTSV
jgi:2-dehydropantoate 2-reductase